MPNMWGTTGDEAEWPSRREVNKMEEWEKRNAELHEKIKNYRGERIGQSYAENEREMRRKGLI